MYSLRTAWARYKFNAPKEVATYQPVPKPSVLTINLHEFPAPARWWSLRGQPFFVEPVAHVLDKRPCPQICAQLPTWAKP